MIYTDPVEAAPAVRQALEQAQRILLLSHVNPDGDAIGSMLAMWHTLHAMGKSVVALASSTPPGSVQVLPGYNHIQHYDRGMSLPDFDLVCLLDASTLERTGPVYEAHATTLSVRPLVIIDHHITTIGEGQVNLIVPESSSCADLLYRLLVAMDVPITPPLATCLYMGIVADTQSFQTGGTNAQALRAAADLMADGADQYTVVRSMYYTTPQSTLRLLGLSLCQLHFEQEHGLAWTVVSQEMVRETGADESATDEVILAVQRMAGVRLCAVFKERQDTTQTKISLRSVLGVDVATIARSWGGGGHSQAAGATLSLPLERAVQETLPLLRSHLSQSKET